MAKATTKRTTRTKRRDRKNIEKGAEKGRVNLPAPISCGSKSPAEVMHPAGKPRRTAPCLPWRRRKLHIPHFRLRRKLARFAAAPFSTGNHFAGLSVEA